MAVAETAEAFPRILTVTDSFADQRALSEALSPAFKVIAATSGASALTLLSREQVDVVLAELSLPRENGADFLNEVAKQRDVGRVLLATYAAYAEGARLSRDAYFLAIKPIQAASLLRAVNQALHNARTLRASKSAGRKVGP